MSGDIIYRNNKPWGKCNVNLPEEGHGFSIKVSSMIKRQANDTGSVAEGIYEHTPCSTSAAHIF